MLHGSNGNLPEGVDMQMYVKWHDGEMKYCHRYLTTLHQRCSKGLTSCVRRKFSWGVLVQGHMVVICIWCALFVTSQFEVISMFPNQRFGEVCWIVCIFFYIHSPYIMCRCTEYELSALQVRLSEKNKLNATTQQFIIAKITGCALKQGNETHSSLHQSNWQLQNQATLRSRQIRAVEHWRCAAGLAGAHLGLQDRILLKRIKYAKKFCFLWRLEVHRSATRGANPPLEKFSPPREKCAGRILKLLHMV